MASRTEWSTLIFTFAIMLKEKRVEEKTKMACWTTLAKAILPYFYETLRFYYFHC